MRALSYSVFEMRASAQLSTSFSSASSASTCASVVAHEVTHFLQANHSARFYEELARYMPDYKQREKLLK